MAFDPLCTSLRYIGLVVSDSHMYVHIMITERGQVSSLSTVVSIYGLHIVTEMLDGAIIFGQLGVSLNRGKEKVCP